jgi:hypothetical protein
MVFIILLVFRHGALVLTPAVFAVILLNTVSVIALSATSVILSSKIRLYSRLFKTWSLPKQLLHVSLFLSLLSPTHLFYPF